MSAARENVLAPAKIDKPKIAEILPFSADSDYSSHPKMTRADNSALLKRSYNCCQAVLLAYADLLPYDKDALIALGSTFGSGMGGMMGTCGALAGAQMVLGILGYKGSNMNRYSRELFCSFEELCGASRCIDIKGVTTGRALCSCEDCVRHAVEAIEELGVSS